MSKARNIVSRAAPMKISPLAVVRAPPTLSEPGNRRQLRRHAERHFPADIAGREIHGGQRAPRRRIARQTARRHQGLAIHAVGRAALRGELAARARGRGSLRLVPRRAGPA